MPTFKFKTLDEIPEDVRGEAKQVDGGFELNLVSNKKLVEFRDSNITLSRERDDLKAKVTTYAGIVGDDPEEFKTRVTEWQQVHQQVKDGKLKGSEAITAEVENRVKQTKETLEGQLRELGHKLSSAQSEGTGWKQKYEQSVLNQVITGAVIGKDSVANPEALPDILARAASTFVVQPDGSVVPKKGDTVIYGSDGATPMSPKEWLTKLVAEAPYLGKPSAGGGADGERGDGRIGGIPKDQFDKLDPATRITKYREAQGRK